MGQEDCGLRRIYLGDNALHQAMGAVGGDQVRFEVQVRFLELELMAVVQQLKQAMFEVAVDQEVVYSEKNNVIH